MDAVERWAALGAVAVLAVLFVCHVLRTHRALKGILADIDALDDEVGDMDEHLTDFYAQPILTPGPVSMPLTVTTLDHPVLVTNDPATTGSLPAIEAGFTPDPNPPTVTLPPLPAPVKQKPVPVEPETQLAPAFVAKPRGKNSSASALVNRYWAEHEKAKAEKAKGE